MGFGIWDLGFGIWDLGFGIWDLGFSDLGFMDFLNPNSKNPKSPNFFWGACPAVRYTPRPTYGTKSINQSIGVPRFL